MKSDFSHPGHHCCAIEKKQLVEELRTCDMCTDSYEELHECYREASRQSAKRAKQCMYS